MGSDTGFVGYVEDLLQAAGPVEVRPMFGGHGVFLDGVMFGLVADDVLYLKADEVNRGAFDDAGLEPFVYDKGGRPTAMAYCRAPEPLDRADLIDPWVISAIGAARRAARRKRRPTGG